MLRRLVEVFNKFDPFLYIDSNYFSCFGKTKKKQNDIYDKFNRTEVSYELFTLMRRDKV